MDIEIKCINNSNVQIQYFKQYGYLTKIWKYGYEYRNQIKCTNIAISPTEKQEKTWASNKNDGLKVWNLIIW